MAVRRKPRIRLDTRAAGVLLHPTSLPGRHGIGDLGEWAYRFVDFLHDAGLTWWQMLPINPIGPGYSPYSALSAFAGNPLLISLDGLADEGLLDKVDLSPARGLRADRVNYASVTRYKLARLRGAFERFVKRGGLQRKAFERFREQQAGWLDDHALYSALRKAHDGKPWVDWPAPLRRRQKRALTRAADEHADEINFERFLQYIFDRQWIALRKHANSRGVGLIGDIPIFVAHDSSDVWAHPELFDLDERGRARTVSGVPPDYFSKTGQRWGHPHYHWSRHKATGFAWWLARFSRVFEQVDATRIDHFLGFNRVWAVPGRAKTARRGKWVKTPGRELFDKVQQQLGRPEVIAEDLGLLVPEAAALRDRYAFPGMRLLQFAFGNDEGDRYHQPHNHPPNAVVYPGTHDNDTTVGWFEQLAKVERRQRGERLNPYRRVLRYTGSDGRQIHWEIIRLALLSPARTAIVPMQDLLGLDNKSRMNTPATTSGNWCWRLRRQQLTGRLAERVRKMAHTYERIPPARR